MTLEQVKSSHIRNQQLDGPITLKLHKLDFIQIRIFCSEKDTVKEMKRQATDWVKVFGNHLLDEGLLSRIHKELSKVTCKKMNNSILKMGEIFEETLHQRKYWTANRHR